MLTLDSSPGRTTDTPGHTAGFASATAALYRAFDDVGFRAAMPHCGHCVSAVDVAALDAPVQHLDAALVARFVTKAGTTWGASDDLRRVAPRALHLAAEHRLAVNRSVVLDQLARADWARWPAHQVDAVCRFLLAEWDRLLLSPPRAGHSAHRWLRQTATVIADLGPFLTSWHRVLASDPDTAAVHLAVLLVNSELRPDFPTSIIDLFDPPASGAGGDAATHSGSDVVHLPGVGADATDDDARGALADQLGSWLAAPATEAHLHRAEAELRHTADARRLTLALERLRRYRSARARAT